MKTPFSIADGPLAGCSPANTLTVDASLIGLTPEAGDKRFVLRWDRSRRGLGVAQGLYRFTREGESGPVTAVHVPGVDDTFLPTADELERARVDAARATVLSLAAEFPDIREMLKET